MFSVCDREGCYRDGSTSLAFFIISAFFSVEGTQIKEGSTASLRLSLLIMELSTWPTSLSYDYLRLGAFLRIATR